MNLLQKQSTGSPTSSPKRIWRPRTAEEIARKRNRKAVNQHLKKIGKSAGRELTLDQDGVCCFSYKKFVMVVEVPEDNSSMLLFYTKVCQLGPGDHLEEVQKFRDLFNVRQSSLSSTSLQEESSESACPCYFSTPATEPCGTKLSVKDEEVNLCFSVPIHGLSFEDTAAHLERFMKTAVAVNRKLQQIKCTPRSALEPKATAKEAGLPPPSPMNRLRLWSADSATSERSILSSLFTSNTSLGGADGDTHST